MYTDIKKIVIFLVGLFILIFVIKHFYDSYVCLKKENELYRKKYGKLDKEDLDKEYLSKESFKDNKKEKFEDDVGIIDDLVV